MSTNKNDGVDTAGRAPRHYQFISDSKNNNDLKKNDELSNTPLNDTSENKKTEEKDNYRVRIPEGHNTRNARQNNFGWQANETNLSARRETYTKNSNPIANDMENKTQNNENEYLSRSNEQRKVLNRTSHYKSEQIVYRPSEPLNQAKANQQSNYPSQYQNQPSVNQIKSKSPQYQQVKTSNQQSNFPYQSSTNQNQSHLPQFQQQNRYIQNPFQPTTNQQNSPLPPLKQQNRYTQIKWPFHSNKLPQYYLPTFYDLYLDFTKQPNQIEGIVTITFERKEKHNSIFLNIDVNLSINSIIQNGIELEYDVKYPFLLIYQSNKLEIEISSHPITIKYTVQPFNTFKRSPFNLKSKDDDDQKGLFTCDGSYLTHFEPNHTRKLLPCFDEPYPKVVFKVHLRIPKKFEGISNMPVEDLKINGNEKEIVFKNTPLMCAYLLCICVGQFKMIQGETKSGLPIKIYSKNCEKQIFKNFLKVAIFTIEWIESKLKASYDLPHLQIVSHRGFYYYAMENYGLITCPDESKYMETRGNFIIAHEIIHQWFGDSVSIKWWDSIWLNEGFASFLEFIVIKEFGFDGNIWDDFINFKAPYALSYFDSGIISPPENSIDFDNMFDQLLYTKGAYIVKMFYDIIGDVDFFDFCSKWLMKFKNKSVDISDFLSLVNSTLNKNYDDFFKPWLNEVGFPFLFVDEILSDNKKIIGIKISQKVKNNVLYHFKISILYGKNDQSNLIEIMIDELIKTVYLDFDWIIVNYNINSLCYVCYSNLLLQKLIELTDDGKMNKFNIYLINQSNSRRQMLPFSFFRS